MKFTLNVLEKNSDAAKRWPAYVFGGRMRTSTVILVLAFFGVWWVYSTYHNEVEPAKQPPTQYVPIPPGMQPDPNYTWVPKTRVDQQPRRTYEAPIPTTTTPPRTTTPPPPTTTTTTTTTTPPPPFQLPCIPPFCTPSTTPSTAPGPAPAPLPLPGLPLAPTSPAPAR